MTDTPDVETGGATLDAKRRSPTTMASVTILGMLVLIQTFLSWALVVEMEGRWPWQGSSPARPPAVTGVREAA